MQLGTRLRYRSVEDHPVKPVAELGVAIDVRKHLGITISSESVVFTIEGKGRYLVCLKYSTCFRRFSASFLLF